MITRDFINYLVDGFIDDIVNQMGRSNNGFVPDAAYAYKVYQLLMDMGYGDLAESWYNSCQDDDDIAFELPYV